LGVWNAADLGQKKGIDVAVRGNEIEVATNAGLGGMYVTKIVRAVDDPEFSVAGGKVENLFIVGWKDKGREMQFSVDRNNVLLAVFHDPGTVARCQCARHYEGKPGDQGAPRDQTNVQDF